MLHRACIDRTVGTGFYMSPEIYFLHALPPQMRNNVLSYYYYTKAADWWSVGATAYKLLTGKHAVGKSISI